MAIAMIKLFRSAKHEIIYASSDGSEFLLPRLDEMSEEDKKEYEAALKKLDEEG